ncbi:HEAT repeat-containing protein 6 isoform X3 [Zea mays]|uniref:ARM repeat superfamily protein n=1 Tax=Zea mays TaxID=4577 RepID=A0A1D6J0F4_MAIZE|nr:HEAT repeat-containing protein 6 isoform X3 [Zea mays]AQK41565.1 ARM repeat superfamily protein [Zea mays]|eukprot:XP_020401692.1 HEAT repeat-containing protein 6 isoform X3 [Zea mays]
MMASASASGGGARPWRTALLTLRDESLASPSPTALLELLRQVLLTPASPSLAASAAGLPPHEVGSDVAFLADTAAAAAPCPGAGDALRGVCHLIHDVMSKTNMEINPSGSLAMLKFLDKLVKCSIEGACMKGLSSRTSALNTASECLHILRFWSRDYGRGISLAESSHSLTVLVSIVSFLQAELNISDKPANATGISSRNSGSANSKNSNIWDMKISAFSMLEDILSKVASNMTENLWQSVIEVLRKVMDFVTARNLVIESSIMSRFYTSFLRCLHLVLVDPKGPLSGHVAGFVANLQIFFVYGLRSSSPPTLAPKETRTDSKPRASRGRYRPPHLRNKERRENDSLEGQNSDSEYSWYDMSSSDSDLSDSDGYAKSGDRFRSSKARLAAILCIQDICHADPKLLTSQWPVLLPENDVLQQRKYQATLMTCLLFDPITKVRVEAASTIATMLERQALVLTQVAEYKESSKRGSFTTLSSSLGQILMQLHTGALYLIQRETQATLLAALFRVLILLISATPYARMPKELLPTVIKVLCSRLLNKHSNKTEHYAVLVTVLSCLETAFSKVPPTLDVFAVLTEDCCAGPSHEQEESNVIAFLLHCIEEEMHYSVRHGAFQVLRSAVHNYPSCANMIWEKLRDNVLNLLQIQSFEDQKYDANFGPPGAKEESSIKGRCLVAGIKVMDECLRVSSGFTGADDIKECRLLDIQQISDCTINKTIKSAPHFEMEAAGSSQNCTLDITLGINRWIEVIETHLPQGLSHGSAMVRTASLTCFAGMTSDVFFSLPENKRDYVTSSSVHAALNDMVPSVRSAACRAIGIVACFPQILSSSSLPGKFIDAIEFNTHNSSTPVRVTAAWALANLCSCIRFRALEVHTDPYAGVGVLSKSSISLLVEVALRLAKDSEKVKSNAVRALGYLSRFIRFNYHAGTINDPSDSVFYGDPVWLERMVQALMSCVTTGNVKVQWNVCHALSNLFMNDTLRLQDMPWASSVYSILLLLIRDSNNYKIKMHAAVALSVPVSRLDYGSSFPDVVRGLVHALESLNSNNSSLPSNFKQRDNLEKQLTFTALHLLSFVSPNDDPSLKDFLTKKSSFLEDWLRSLCASFNSSERQPLPTEATNDEDGFSPNVTQKGMLSSALQSLLGVYAGRTQQVITQRFEQLARSVA